MNKYSYKLQYNNMSVSCEFTPSEIKILYARVFRLFIDLMFYKKNNNHNNNSLEHFYLNFVDII